MPIQRLNRTEYAATVKALVGVDVNAKEVLPQDIQVEGFDNIATALSISPRSSISTSPRRGRWRGSPSATPILAFPV